MTIYPFLQLSKEDRSKYANELQSTYATEKKISKKVFGQHYRAVLEVMAGTKEESALLPIQTDVLNDLNDAAFVKPWKNELHSFEILTYLIAYGSTVPLVPAGVSLGLSLLYMRSHKVIALASGCAAISCLVLRNTCFELIDALGKQKTVIENLTWRNQAGFSSEIDQVYAGLKKTSWLMRYYLNQQERYLGKEHFGLVVLKQQLAALVQIQNLPLSFLLSVKTETADQPRIQTFFKKAEPLFGNGFRGTLGLSLLGLGWTGYTLTQKAYLMTVIGLVQSLGLFALARSFYVLQQGSKRIYESQSIATDLQTTLQRLFFNQVDVTELSEATIETAFVVPLDAIFKLIPSWNEVK